MIYNSRVLNAIPRSRACIKLFQQHENETYALRLLAKIRTQRRKWRQALHSAFREIYPREIIHIHSRSSSTNTLPTSTTNHQVAVICRRGQDRASFCGTQYRVANQVFLFLTTGMSGDILLKKSSTDLMKEVASSSYSSALLRVASQIRSTKKETGSYVQATHPHEAYGQARHPLPDPESSLPSMRDLPNFLNNR